MNSWKLEEFAVDSQELSNNMNWELTEKIKFVKTNSKNNLSIIEVALITKLIWIPNHIINSVTLPTLPLDPL